jgi:polysaccharide biosynthesis/export protein
LCSRDGLLRVWHVLQKLGGGIALALALSGCISVPPPVATYTTPTAARPDLDQSAYGGEATPASVASAQASVAQAPVAQASGAQAAVTPIAYASEQPYRLDASDRLRIVVYGQDGLTNSYSVDAGGAITMPLIGAVHARGLTPAALAQAITAKLRNGYLREPYVAVEVETYRPFFILGEVAAPGQYPYVPNMTVESAVAIAGGFSPRAQKNTVDITRTEAAGPIRASAPLGTLLRPGDTIVVGERWF